MLGGNQLTTLRYEKSYWQNLLEQNVIMYKSTFFYSQGRTAVASLYIPETHVIKPGAHHFKFTLENMKLKHEVDHYRGKHQEIFTKLFKKKRVEKAKKIMVHPIRCCQFALQILEEGLAFFLCSLHMQGGSTIIQQQMNTHTTSERATHKLGKSWKLGG